jgi:Phytochelatin synthase
MAEETRNKIPVRRILLYALLALAAAVLLAVGAILGPLPLARNEYAQVQSIEARADFRDPALMSAAWALPVARKYRREDYEYQDNQSFCGPASVANLLRSLGIDRSQHQVIDGSEYEPWFGILLGGMTLDELAALLRQQVPHRVSIIRDPSLTEFRQHLRSANDPARRYVVNFHRGPVFGRGHGHFSPVLGYLGHEDLVLVGDTNADYRPFLVKSEILWRATDTIDSETGRERGLIMLSRAHGPAQRQCLERR